MSIKRLLEKRKMTAALALTAVLTVTGVGQVSSNVIASSTRTVISVEGLSGDVSFQEVPVFASERDIEFPSSIKATVLLPESEESQEESHKHKNQDEEPAKQGQEAEEQEDEAVEDDVELEDDLDEVDQGTDTVSEDDAAGSDDTDQTAEDEEPSIEEIDTDKSQENDTQEDETEEDIQEEPEAASDESEPDIEAYVDFAKSLIGPVTVYAADTEVIDIPVTWKLLESESDASHFNSGVNYAGFRYVYKAKLPRTAHGYILKADASIALPTITVKIGSADGIYDDSSTSVVDGMSSSDVLMIDPLEAVGLTHGQLLDVGQDLDELLKGEPDEAENLAGEAEDSVSEDSVSDNTVSDNTVSDNTISSNFTTAEFKLYARDPSFEYDGLSLKAGEDFKYKLIIDDQPVEISEDDIDFKYAPSDGNGKKTAAYMTGLPKNVGTYVIMGTIQTDSEDVVIESNILELSIFKAEMVVIGADVKNKKYDGETDAEVERLIFKLDCLKEDDFFEMGVDYEIESADFRSSEPGKEIEVKVIYTILESELTGNYDLVIGKELETSGEAAITGSMSSSSSAKKGKTPDAKAFQDAKLIANATAEARKAAAEARLKKDTDDQQPAETEPSANRLYPITSVSVDALDLYDQYTKADQESNQLEIKSDAYKALANGDTYQVYEQSAPEKDNTVFIVLIDILLVACGFAAYFIATSKAKRERKNDEQ